MEFFTNRNVLKYYYFIKPLIPRRIQILVRSRAAVRTRKLCADHWPIDPQSGNKPGKWQGWPGGKRFALVLTHDVDTANGHEKCRQLMQMEKSLGFCSSFNFVAAQYRVSSELRRNLTDHGFEVGVHGLVHNKKLYESREIFLRHAAQINRYMKDWKSVGFRSPCMYHNLDWLSDLDIEYDASTFDTDPFEPQPDGARTIFPFYVQGHGARKGYVELPYTLPQDFTLFILLKERSTHIWRQKVDWIAQQGGMVLLNSHPDYMNAGGKPGYEEYPAEYYREFLAYVSSRYGGEYWQPLPKEMAAFWSEKYGSGVAPSSEQSLGASIPERLKRSSAEYGRTNSSNDSLTRCPE